MRMQEKVNHELSQKSEVASQLDSIMKGLHKPCENTTFLFILNLQTTGANILANYLKGTHEIGLKKKKTNSRNRGKIDVVYNANGKISVSSRLFHT